MSFLSSVFGCGDATITKPRPTPEVVSRNKNLPPQPPIPHNTSTTKASPPRIPGHSDPHHNSSPLQERIPNLSAYPHSRRPSLKPLAKPYNLHQPTAPPDLLHRTDSHGGYNIMSPQHPRTAEPNQYAPSLQERNYQNYYPSQLQPGYRPYPMPLAYQPVFVPPPHPMGYGHYGPPMGHQPYSVAGDWVIYPSQFPSAQAHQQAFNPVGYSEAGQLSPSSFYNRHSSENMSPLKMQGQMGRPSYPRSNTNFSREYKSLDHPEPPRYSIVSPNPCTVITHTSPIEKVEMWSQTHLEDVLTDSSENKIIDATHKLIGESTSSTAGVGNSGDIRSDDSQFSESIPRLSPQSENRSQSISAGIDLQMLNSVEARRLFAISSSPPRPTGSFDQDASANCLDEDVCHKKSMSRFVSYIPDATLDEFYLTNQDNNLEDDSTAPKTSRPVHCVQFPLYQANDRISTAPQLANSPSGANKFVVRPHNSCDTKVKEDITTSADQMQTWKDLCSIASGACSCQSCSDVVTLCNDSSSPPNLPVTKMTLPPAETTITPENPITRQVKEIKAEPLNPFSPEGDEKWQVNTGEDQCSAEPGHKPDFKSSVDHDICDVTYSKSPGPLPMSIESALISQRNRLTFSARSHDDMTSNCDRYRSSPSTKDRDCKSGMVRKMVEEWNNKSPNREGKDAGRSKTKVESTTGSAVRNRSIPCNLDRFPPGELSSKMIDRSLDSIGMVKGGVPEAQRSLSYDVGTITDIRLPPAIECGPFGNYKPFSSRENPPNKNPTEFTRHSSRISFSPIDSINSRSVTVSVWDDSSRPSSCKIHDKIDLQLQVELRSKCPISTLLFLRMKRLYYAVVEAENLDDNDKHGLQSESLQSEVHTPHSVDRARTLDFYTLPQPTGRETVPTCTYGRSYRPSLYSRTADDLPNKVLCFARVEQTLGQLRMCVLDRTEVKRHFGWKALQKWLYYGNVTVLDSWGPPPVPRSASVSFENVDRRIPDGGTKVWRQGQYVQIETFLNHIQFVNGTRRNSLLRRRKSFL